MLKRLLFLSSVLSLNLLLSGCATSPPDTPICVEIHPSKGWCTHTISGKEFFVDDTNLLKGKTWWEMRPSMVHLPASSWAETKAFIIKVCKQTGQCKKEISSWDRTVESIDTQLGKK